MKNRIISILMIICMMASFQVYASDDSNIEFTDTSGVSDADFFGMWDISSQSWSVSPQLNYDGFSGLAPVKSAAQSGNYTLAKEELLKYYRNRTGISFPEKPHTAAAENTIFWAMHDSLAYKDSYLTDIDITSQSFTEYSIDLGKNANSGAFYLSSLQKSKDMIEIYSRESEYAPKLVVTKKNGETITLESNKDTYIRAGVYADKIYGSESFLYVKDDYTLSDGKYLPYGDNTRRSYVFFDNDKIPSGDISSVKLVITARLKAESEEVTDSSINLVVVNPYNKSWSETNDGSSLEPMTWSNYEIGHFSWQGLPGGIVWEKPENSQNEFLNSNTRFTQLSALVRKASVTGDNKYLHKSMELILDFIGETTDQISTGVPYRRDIESANRCHEFSSFYKFYLDSEFMTPDANAAMLKWLYKETSYLYNGAAILYNGPTDDIRQNKFAYTNRGAWHCAGLLASTAYFPEFADSENWEEVLNKRLKKNVDYLIADDGCYLEATFGYSENVIKHYRAMITTWENTNKEPLANLDEKLLRLGRYLMYVGYPDGEAPKWGDNSGSSRTMIKKIIDYVNDPELMYYASEGKEGTVPSKNSIQLDSLKIVTSRTGWGADDSVLFINALNAGNHRHRDSLALTLYHDGKEILEDTGNTAYDADHPHFPWQRGTTRSHNTIEIDETPQTTTNVIENGVPGYIDLNANDNADMITAWTDGTEGFRHNRNLLWIKDIDLLVVNDMVEPSDNKVHKYTQNWHTYSGYSSNPTINVNTFKGATNYNSGTQLLIAQADTSDLKLELLEGYSCISSEPTKYFSYEKNVAGNAVFSTALVPVREGDFASVDTTKLSVAGTGHTQAMNIALNQNGVLRNVVTFTAFEGDGSNHTFGGYTTDADGAYFITDLNGNLTGGGMYGGSFVKLGQKTVLKTNRDMDSVTFTISDGVVNLKSDDDCALSDFVLGDALGSVTATVNADVKEETESAQKAPFAPEQTQEETQQNKPQKAEKPMASNSHKETGNKVNQNVKKEQYDEILTPEDSFTPSDEDKDNIDDEKTSDEKTSDEKQEVSAISYDETKENNVPFGIAFGAVIVILAGALAVVLLKKRGK